MGYARIQFLVEKLAFYKFISSSELFSGLLFAAACAGGDGGGGGDSGAFAKDPM